MSRAHTRLLRDVNQRLAEARRLAREADWQDFDDGDDWYDDEDDRGPHCMVCSSELGSHPFHEHCSMCGMPGCDVCLMRGDDCFPYLCAACDGGEDDEDWEIDDLMADEVEA